MKFPSILNRIILGLVIKLTLIIGISLVFISNIQKLNLINSKIINHPFAVSNAVKDIHIGITSMHRSMKDVALSKNNEDLNKAISLVNKYEQEVFKSFGIITNRYLGDINDVIKAQDSFENWKPIRSEVIALARENKNDDAYYITTQKGARYVDMLLEQIDIIKDFAINKASEINSNSKEVSKRTLNNSLIILSFSVLVFLIISFWIFYSVSNPLKKMIARINKIPEVQDANITLPDTKNILCVLHSSVDNLDNLVQNLEKIVTERTQELTDEKDFTELALNSQNDTFFVFDPETGNPTRWNKTFTRAVGYTNIEISKMKVPESFFNQNELNKFQETINKVQQNGFAKVILNLITRSGEYIPFEYMVTKINHKKTGKKYIVSIGRDITERLIQESELEKHRNKLQEMVDDQTKEIQSINEELKTSNEELAALNEELTAANEELGATNEKLTSTNEDLERTTNKLLNLNKELLEANQELERFNSLFVDREFRIKELKEKVKVLEKQLDDY